MDNESKKQTVIEGEAEVGLAQTVARDADVGSVGADASHDYEIGSGENNDDEALDRSIRQLESGGRYRVVDTLGRGGFGTVLLAEDETLKRKVAIKIPRRRRLTTRSDVEMFLNEARALANLDHPNVLPIFDFGETDDGNCYTVSKYIDGATLGDLLLSNAQSFRANIEILVKVLDALAAVHEEGIVHRDVKPHNILVDSTGTPYLGDFGLALTATHQESLRMVGTLKYMSPEQCRGESHLVDGRADIFSVAVILYVVLTGDFPFNGETPHQIYERIVLGAPKPPRQFKRSVPRELERICLKALSSRASDRYTTAYDFANELRDWLATNASEADAIGDQLVSPAVISNSSLQGTSTSNTITPRGLRSFGERDATFFLKLLPGPRGRTGLPDVVEHWKEWIERQRDDDATSRIGVIYGPSGCGKSSLIRAGVLPNLDQSTMIVFAEATRDGTEDSIRKSFARVLTDSDQNASLAELAADVRTGRGMIDPDVPVVIVIDQLEQWLAGNRVLGSSDFAALLRQCDGNRLKAVLLVRDDFWVPLSRLLEFVEVPFSNGENAQYVDLFDINHARRVLHEFGHAYGQLPSSKSQLTPEQDRFLEEAVDTLASNGSVFPVRIAVFAEMIKSRSWSLATLRQFGGVEGVGVRFLEETFESEAASARFRQYAPAAAKVLNALLPDSNSLIRGESPTYSELRTQSGFDDDPRSFSELIGILDHELRLISVTRDVVQTGSTSFESTESGSISDDSRYLLAHEYLIPSVREWLNRRRRDSVRGRTILLYEDCLADWKVRGSAGSLPGFIDWCRFHLMLQTPKMVDEGQAMMRAANRYHGLRVASIAVLTMLLAFCGYTIWDRNQTDVLVKQIQTASVAELPALTDLARSRRPEVVYQIEDWLQQEDLPVDRYLVGVATLTYLGRESEDTLQYLLDADPRERRAVCEMLAKTSDTLVEDVKAHLVGDENPLTERLAAAQALALLHPRDVDLLTLIEANEALTDELIRQQMYSGEFIDDWTTSFDSVADLMIEKLSSTAFNDARTPESVEATKLVLRWCRGNAKRTFDYLLDVQSWQETPEFLEVIQQSVPENINRLKSLVDSVIADLDSSETSYASDVNFRRAGHAIVLLAELGDTDQLYTALRRRIEPALRVEVIHRLAKSRVKTDQIGQFLAQVTIREKPEKQINVDSQAALLKVLSMRPRPSQSIRDNVYGRAQASDVAEVHSAAILCLANWEELDEFEPRIDQPIDGDNRRWRVNSQGQVLISIATTPLIGPALHASSSPLSEFDLEFMATEVSTEQYLKFRPGDYINYDVSATGHHPANVITFAEAVAYARWLTAAEELGEAEQCYPPVDDVDAGVPSDWQPYPDHRERTGYRLPTMEEWEFAVRGGVLETLPYLTGREDRRMRGYAWSYDNSRSRAQPIVSCLPNRNGLFNAFGNVAEWTIDAHEASQRYLAVSSYQTSQHSMQFGVRKSSNEQTFWNQIGMRLVRSVPSR